MSLSLICSIAVGLRAHGSHLRSLNSSRHLSGAFYSIESGCEDMRLRDTILSGTAAELQELLASDAVNPNHRFKELRNCTPLMLAAEYNKCDMIEKLLKFGASLDTQDELGDTAVMIAARENNKRAVFYLADHGAQLDISNYEQMTASDCTLDMCIDSKIRRARGDLRDASQSGHQGDT